MHLISRSARALLVACCLSLGTVYAALPDPITFSLTIERGDIAKARAWLDEGLDPEFQAPTLGSGLMIAAWNGNIDMMALFMERGASPKQANRNGEQPLLLAAWNGHLAAVKWLLEHGATANREGKAWGALHYAVFNDHQDVAKYLLEQGAAVNAYSPNGSTPLMLAAREGREDLTRILIAAGADAKAKNDWGDSALTLAMRYDHYSVGKMISSAEEFAVAVKAPKETFGEPARSAAAPNEIEELLRKIREAEAEGRPSEELRKQLQEAITVFRRNAIAQRDARRPAPLPYQPKSIVITAKRGKPGVERAQVVVTGKQSAPVDAKNAGKAAASAVTPKQRAIQAQIADLMRLIRLAEAQGRPAEDMRQQLSVLVDSLEKP
jgi:uncharacterized protein